MVCAQRGRHVAFGGLTVVKSLIEVGVVALVVGGLSAAGSFYWQQTHKMAAAEVVAPSPTEEKPPEQKLDTVDATDGNSELKTDEPPGHSEDPKVVQKTDSAIFGPPVAARPPFDPTGDEAGELINKLRTRAATASRHERRVADREEVMKLIVDDLRVEQANSAKMRQRILQETNQSLRTIDEARRQTESERIAIQNEQVEVRRNADEKIEEIRREKDQAAQSAEEALKAVREEQEEMKKQLDELRDPRRRDKSGSPEETTNLKKMVGVVDSMPPEDTAKILQELVQEGKTEAVVAVLDAMKPRQSAKVLSVITENDPILAADLVDRLKKLKKAGAQPAEPVK